MRNLAGKIAVGPLVVAAIVAFCSTRADAQVRFFEATDRRFDRFVRMPLTMSYSRLSCPVFQRFDRSAVGD